jgi:predicted small lipoprotein YifL
MKTKILSLLTALMMLLSFAACGTAKGNTTNTTANKKSETAMLTAVNPKTKDEAADHRKMLFFPKTASFGKRYLLQPIKVWR